MGIGGFWITLVQLARVRTSTDAANDAINAFRLKLKTQNASREIAEALTAIETTKRYLISNNWTDASQSYETVLRSLIRLQSSNVIQSDVHRATLGKNINHISAFCDKVDAARAEKAAYPDKHKVLPALRKMTENLMIFQTHVEKDML